MIAGGYKPTSIPTISSLHKLDSQLIRSTRATNTFFQIDHPQYQDKLKMSDEYVDIWPTEEYPDARPSRDYEEQYKPAFDRWIAGNAAAAAERERGKPFLHPPLHDIGTDVYSPPSCCAPILPNSRRRTRWAWSTPSYLASNWS